MTVLQVPVPVEITPDPICGYRTAHVLRDPIADARDPCAYVVAWVDLGWLHGGRHADIRDALAHAARLEQAPAEDRWEWTRMHGGCPSGAAPWARVQLAERMEAGR